MTTPILDLSTIRRFPQAYWAFDMAIRHFNRNLKQYTEDYGPLSLVLTPDYQRGHVWTTEQRVAYMEYLLKGGEAGRDITWNCPGWSKGHWNPGEFTVLDGLQRMTTVMMWNADELAVFGGYTRSSCIGEDAGTLKVRIVELSRADCLQYYIDRNVGGTPHSDEEIDRVRALIHSAATPVHST